MSINEQARKLLLKKFTEDEVREILSPNKFLNQDELLEKYGIGISNQAKMRMKREIPFCKINRYIRYSTNEIDAWIESNKVEVV